MPKIKDAAAEFLAKKRIAVTGVSREPETHGSNVGGGDGPGAGIDPLDAQVEIVRHRIVVVKGGRHLSRQIEHGDPGVGQLLQQRRVGRGHQSHDRGPQPEPAIDHGRVVSLTARARLELDPADRIDVARHVPDDAHIKARRHRSSTPLRRAVLRWARQLIGQANHVTGMVARTDVMFTP